MSNPLLNIMKPNLNKITKGMANPQQMLMNVLKQRNPQGYQQLMQLMNSGANPEEVLNQMSANLTPDQVAQVKSMANKYGIKL